MSYIGDGIMAVFGAPIEQGDHADRALRAAEEMLTARLSAFNGWLRSNDLGEPFRAGIGLSSGPVMSGNVGAPWRLEYTAIGDTTNVAARLQAKAGELGASLLIAESTRSRLSLERDLFHVGELHVSGRGTPIQVWSEQLDGGPTRQERESLEVDAS